MERNPLLFRNIRALALIGLWPPENSKFHGIYHIFSKSLFVWFCCFTTSQLFELCHIYDDFKETTSNAGVSLLYTVAIAKIYIVLFKKKNVLDLVNTIRDTELTILKENDEGMKKILDEYIEQNWSVTRKFWMLTFVTIFGFFVSPSIESYLEGSEEVYSGNETIIGSFKKPLVFSSWFPFDKYSEEFYALAYGIQTFSGIIGASYLGIWDTFIVALMIFAIGQLRVLQYSIKNLGNFENNNDLDNFYLKVVIDQDKIKKNLLCCFDRHKKIIRYSKDLDVLISPVMFLDLVVCSLMLCAIGLQAVLIGPSVRLGFTIEYLIAMLIQLFMYYWHANEIMLESLKVSYSAWESQWYDFPQEIKKDLILLMLRAQRPIFLTAGKFYTMSLQTFIMILRTSYSYMALLRQVYGRENENNQK